MSLRPRGIPLSLRKRILVVTITALLFVVSAALAVVWRATGTGVRRAAKVVQLRDTTGGRQAIAGVGCSLAGLPATNLIAGGSFGPDYYHAHYFASSGSSGEFSVKVSDTPDNVPQADGYFAGASLTLFRETQNGMRHLASGQIKGYEAGQVSGMRPVEPASPIPEDVRWTGFAELNDLTVACGSKGSLLRMPRDGEVEYRAIGFPVDLTSIAAGPGGFLAGDSAGRFYTSSDGVVWQMMPMNASGPIRSIRYIALPDFENGFFLASGGPGEVFFGHSAGLEPLPKMMEEIVTCFVVSDDGVIFALGLNGHVMSSANGVTWAIEEALTSEYGWLWGDAAGGIAFFVGAEGQMALRYDKGSIRRIESAGFDRALEEASPDAVSGGRRSHLTDVVVLTTNHLVIKTDNGIILHSEDQGNTWKLEGPFFGSQAAKMERMRSGNIFIAQNNGNIMRAELTAEFKFEPQLTGEKVLPGDLAILSLPQANDLDTLQLTEPYRQDTLLTGEWAISGGASFANGDDADKGGLGLDTGGSCSLSYVSRKDLDEEAASDVMTPAKEYLFSVARGTVDMNAVNNPDHSYLSARMTQKIDTSRLIRRDSNPFYQLEFDARTSGNIEGKIEIWFSGPYINSSESVAVSSGQWEHRRLTFVFPGGVKPDDELWVNFGFSGSGTLFLDNIWFGRNDDAPHALSSLVTAEEKGPTLPVDVVRLDCVPIGRSRYPSETWALPEGRAAGRTGAALTHNLGAVLQYTERLNAVPWLVVDVRVTARELANLVEYLAGSPLSAYGKLRSRDGAIGRWSDTFDVIYLECTDLEGVLPNDIARANYVHWMMEQIVGAPDYHDVKNKVFIIDGMTYDDGRSHTAADFHAGDFLLDGPIRNAEDVEANVTRWVNSIPRRRMAGDRFMPELIRSVSTMRLGDEVQLVDIALPLVSDLGNHSAIALASIDLSEERYLSGDHTVMRALQVCRGLAGKVLLDEPEPLLSGQHAGGGDDGGGLENQKPETVYYFTYRSREGTTAIAVNISEEPQIIAIQGFENKETLSELYDRRGILISEGTSAPDRVSFTLLPGGVLVLRQESQLAP